MYRKSNQYFLKEFPSRSLETVWTIIWNDLQNLLIDFFLENEYETKVQSICFCFCWSFLVFFPFNLGVDFFVPFCFRKKPPPVHYSSVGNSVTQHAKYNYWPVWGWMFSSQNFNNKLSPAACTCYPCFCLSPVVLTFLFLSC